MRSPDLPVPSTSLIVRDYAPRRSNIRQGPSPIASAISTTATVDEESAVQWQDIEPLTTRPRVLAFPCPLPEGTYKPRKISHPEDKELQTDLRRGGEDLYDPQAKKESPRGEAWRRTRRARIEKMIRNGELSEETVEMIRKLWLRNPPEETMVVKRPQRPKPRTKGESTFASSSLRHMLILSCAQLRMRVAL
jgi:hypothetical protein